ncbi:MAG: efflux RND transporter periplasmic adaptor subunit [Clostridia bacterium]|nr:efflux RND transporter periplasmic adaptor subunit [Clostridia bacterium]
MKKVIIGITLLVSMFAVVKYLNISKAEIRQGTYPVRMDIADVLTVNGTVVEKQRKDIYIKSPAEIVRIYVTEGDEVSKGDIIAEVIESEGIRLNIPESYIVNSIVSRTEGEAVYCTADEKYIRSPIDGTVMEINCAEGERTSPVIPMFSVSDLDELGITAKISEDVVHKIKKRMEVAIIPNVKDAEQIKGVVTDIKPYAVKAMNLMSIKEEAPKTEVSFDIVDKSERIRPGYSVTMKITTNTSNNALTIPYEYISQEDTQQYVYVLGAGGMAEKRIIETGYELENVCEVRNGIGEKDLLLMYDESTKNVPPEIKVKNEKK